MKNRIVFLVSVAITLILNISGCTLIGDIFKAGVWVGIILVVAVVGLIFFIFSKMSKK